MKKDQTEWKSQSQREERKERLEKQKGRDGGKKPIRKRFPLPALLAIVLLLVVAAGLYYLVQVNNGMNERNKTAAVVNGVPVNALTANFYCGSMANRMIPGGLFGSGGEKMLLSPFGMGPDAGLLRDYLLKSFKTQIEDVVYMSELAKKEGVSLSAQDKATVDGMFVQLAQAAVNQQMTLKDLMTRVYGKGADEQSLRPVLEQLLLAGRYQQVKMDGFSFSDDDLEKKYEENKEQYDTVNYRAFLFNAASPAPAEAKGEETPAETEADAKDESASEKEKTTEPAKEAVEESPEVAHKRLMEEAKAKGEAMLAKVKDEESFKAEAIANANESELENYREHDASLVLNARKANISEDFSNWLFDASRKPGDKILLEGPQGYAVLLFLHRERPSARTYSSRHILIKAEGDDEAAKESAKAEIEKIKKEFEDGDKTEERFAKLAEQYSQDGGSAANGGLYKDVKPAQFVKVYEDWCLSDGRKSGDIGIVYADISNYKGYHLIYFIGLGEESWKAEIDQQLRNDAFTAWIEKAREDYSYEENTDGMRFVLPVDPGTLASVRAAMSEAAASEAEPSVVGTSPETSAETSPETSAN